MASDTKIIRADPSSPPAEALREAGAILAAGGLVAFPTETVYGLGAARDRQEAVARLTELKGRDRDKPLSVHLAESRELDRLAAPLSRPARRMVDRLWPGPITLVLPDRRGTTTGFRLPDDPVARAILAAAGRVVVATSANRSGAAPLVTGADVVAAFNGRVDAIVDAGPTRHRAPSTVARVTGRRIEILRDGVVPAERVFAAAALHVLFVCTGNLCRSPMAEGILAAMLSERLKVPVPALPARGVLIRSAGTGALPERPATEAAVLAAADHGADIDRHRSRPLTPTLVADSDRIYVAEARHAQLIEEFLPEARPRVRMLLPDGSDLPDPYGRSDAAYRRTADRIAKALAPLVREIIEELREPA